MSSATLPVRPRQQDVQTGEKTFQEGLEQIATPEEEEEEAGFETATHLSLPGRYWMRPRRPAVNGKENKVKKRKRASRRLEKGAA